MSGFSPLSSTPINDELERLRLWAASLGVSISLDFDEAIHIPDIARDIDDDSTKGNGKRVIDAVLALADARKLEVEIEYLTDEPKLGEYYRHFGFAPYGKPGEITNLRRLPRPAARFDALPIVSFYKLYHVGTMDPADKRSDSYEGAGLSVSLHPEDWTAIARLGGNPCWTLKRVGNRFLDAHSLSRKLKNEIIEWGTNLGFIEPCSIYRLTWADPEESAPRYCEFLSEVEAYHEGEIHEGSSVRIYAGYKSTSILDQAARQSRPTIGTDFCLDLLLPLYADTVHGLDGVWWNDRHDPANLSAPRGVIVSSRLPHWSATCSNGGSIPLAA